jgi:hypothetical protein
VVYKNHYGFTTHFQEFVRPCASRWGSAGDSTQTENPDSPPWGLGPRADQKRRQKRRQSGEPSGESGEKRRKAEKSGDVKRRKAERKAEKSGDLRFLRLPRVGFWQGFGVVCVVCVGFRVCGGWAVRGWGWGLSQAKLS